MNMDIPYVIACCCFGWVVIGLVAIGIVIGGGGDIYD